MYTSAGFTQDFNYSRFKSQELAQLAQTTLDNFKTFLRYTFDGIILIGQELQSVYDQCLTYGREGKKVFKQWLESRSFGTSIYIAKSAMQLYNWFKDLDPRLQRLIRENVQDWKVSALRHLKHLADDVIEAAVTTGKKTASQLKQLSARVAQKLAPVSISANNEETIKDNTDSELTPVELPETTSTEELAPVDLSETSTQEEAPATRQLGLGVRIIVQNESTGWNGACGVITDIGNNNDFWVLLDHAIAQGRPAKNLLKSHQLRLERTSARILTTDDIEQIKAEAIKQYKLENAEIEQARFAEIQGAAEAKASCANASFEKHARNMEAKVSKLVEHLEASEQEIARLQTLNVENQQLQQRVTELENALLKAKEDSWGNIFNAQAAKVLNSNIKKTVPQLLSKIEQLEKDIQEKDAVIVQLQQTAPLAALKFKIINSFMSL
ncbi:hypothetical protein DSM106972_097280 [Dulcicalothrix desertica PCC 7102]|uniref:Uncharacterized protein n=1 Tax=Dulcicalothrix desertica PCC 7102 TaxID=232991 RepID=A0A3S1BX58_9CYAN|nr:hypothetical protein [Dulcicalothrix desertica]RUS93134.1 hypothetical protein DSM106972_097280 [Dulcicalothrix desertica PCC 7102]TWH62785.1 hypothetical protein CAL7102_00313 [Dulcicalothrix desertica PCC 7102]